LESLEIKKESEINQKKIISEEEKSIGTISGAVYKDLFVNFCGYFIPLLIIILALSIVYF
jgi:hypothetical protein